LNRIVLAEHEDDRACDNEQCKGGKEPVTDVWIDLLRDPVARRVRVIIHGRNSLVPCPINVNGSPPVPRLFVWKNRVPAAACARDCACAGIEQLDAFLRAGAMAYNVIMISQFMNIKPRASHVMEFAL